jgi:hypothetical protein
VILYSQNFLLYCVSVVELTRNIIITDGKIKFVLLELRKERGGQQNGDKTEHMWLSFHDFAALAVEDLQYYSKSCRRHLEE